jgi:hypothetical protein
MCSFKIPRAVIDMEDLMETLETLEPLNPLDRLKILFS